LNDLDAVDRKILDNIQSDFPVCERPFLQIAEKVGISEGALIGRIESLKARKIIRRFGAVFDSRKLGYVSTLVAVRIPDSGQLPAVAREVGRFPEVTHNYERENRFNLWFTLIAASGERIREILDRVSSLPGVAEVKDLPAEALYKIKVDFKTTGRAGEPEADNDR